MASTSSANYLLCQRTQLVDKRYPQKKKKQKHSERCLADDQSPVRCLDPGYGSHFAMLDHGQGPVKHARTSDLLGSFRSFFFSVFFSNSQQRHAVGLRACNSKQLTRHKHPTRRREEGDARSPPKPSRRDSRPARADHNDAGPEAAKSPTKKKKRK